MYAHLTVTAAPGSHKALTFSFPRFELAAEPDAEGAVDTGFATVFT
jgi:hypothetical protein